MKTTVIALGKEMFAESHEIVISTYKYHILQNQQV